jgi:exopolyphosphatase/pppGpp-phosphohydrolase
MRLYAPPIPIRSATVAQDPATATYRAARRWVARRLGDVAHEESVAAVAGTVFDLTRPLHGLGRADRRLLRLGAMVHDVGRSVCEDDHPEEGAWMLLADRALPLSPAERRALAYLTLYHRGAVPEAGYDVILRDGDDHGRLRLLLALLRTADTLDNRNLDSPRLEFALAGAGRPQLQVTCYLEEVCAKARRVYRRRKKFRMLEEMLGVRVEVEIVHAEALRLAA